MKKILGSLAAAATVAGLAAAPGVMSTASAAPAKAGVTVTLEGRQEPFGTLTSTRPACQSNRLVVLWKQVGARGGGNDIETGNTDRSDSDGSFDFGSPGLVSGKYYATVSDKKKRCKPGASPTIRIVRD